MGGQEPRKSPVRKGEGVLSRNFALCGAKSTLRRAAALGGKGTGIMRKIVALTMFGVTLLVATAHAAGDRRPEVCTEQYAPVCGDKDGVRKIYSNACFAAADGAQVVNDGQCPVTR